MGDGPAYDAIAEWYDEVVEQHGFQHWLVVPVLLELAGDVSGRRVCDLGFRSPIPVSRRLA
jgi:hypothetical protein